jgi:ribosomal protein L22
MLVKAEQKYIRTSPRKLALVADAVRHLSLDEAILQLSFIRKRAAEPLLKLFKQGF